MNELSDIRYVRGLLEKHGLRLQKALGQNFLVNPGVCPRMAALSGAAEGLPVLEIGPGIGVLTRELAKRAPKVTAVELDRRLFPVLKETLGDCKNVTLVAGDVLKLDLPAFVRAQFGEGPFCVCANLPYYITSPVLMRLLETPLPLKMVTVMVQKEAAERICARPGERACGAVSASVWYHAEPRLLFTVGRGSFLPPPKVDSAVLELRLRETPPVSVPDEGLFFETVRAAFSQRRKTAANSIASAGRYPKARVEAALTAIGQAPDVRAERLSLEALAALSAALINSPLAGEGGTAYNESEGGDTHG